MLDVQMTEDAAALTFSAPRFLSVKEVADAIFQRVLPRRPLELLIPRHRGWLAKITSLWPGSESWLLPGLLKSGRRKQAAYREEKQSR